MYLGLFPQTETHRVTIIEFMHKKYLTALTDCVGAMLTLHAKGCKEDNHKRISNR